MSIISRTLVAAFFAVGLAHAQGYPAKPIKLLVPFPPGGPADTMSRVIARKLGEVLGQSLVLENRGGGGGTIAMGELSRAVADGYTLGIGSNSTLAIAPSLYRKLPYDSIGSFSHVTLVATVTTILLVHQAVPASDLRELIEYAKARPGELNFGSNGNGTVPHLAGMLFQSLTGTRLVHVPYKGMSAALNDLMAGQIQLGLFATSGRESYLKEGKLRALAVASPARIANLPDVPTALEAGLAGFETYTWFGLAGPPGLAPELIQRLNQAVRTALEATDVADAFAAHGFNPAANSPAQFRDFIRAETAKWAPLVKSLGMTID